MGTDTNRRQGGRECAGPWMHVAWVGVGPEAAPTTHPDHVPEVRSAAGAVILMTRRHIKVAARSVAGIARTVQLPQERGAAAATGGSRSGGGPEAPKSQGGIWRCLMRCKVGAWTMIPPQHSWIIYPPLLLLLGRQAALHPSGLRPPDSCSSALRWTQKSTTRNWFMFSDQCVRGFMTGQVAAPVMYICVVVCNRPRAAGGRNEFQKSLLP